MANLTAQGTAVVGTTLTDTAPTATTGDTVPVGSKLIVKNGSGASINVTITTPGNDSYGNARPDIVTAVAAGKDALFGPFPADLADPTTGVVTVVCSAVTTVTLHVVA